MSFALQIDEEDEGKEMGVERFVGLDVTLNRKLALLYFLAQVTTAFHLEVEGMTMIERGFSEPDH